MARNDANHGTGERTIGKVVRLVKDKGFGFVQAADGREYFFHFSNCAPGLWDSLIERGEKKVKGIGVAFDPTQTDKGLRALRVELVAA